MKIGTHPIFGDKLGPGRENIESRLIWPPARLHPVGDYAPEGRAYALGEKPMHMQPVFKNCRIRGGAISEDLFQRGLCLPSGTQMTEEDLERVVKVVRNCCRRNKRK